MISDVLADAIEEIRRYQRDMPSCYEDSREAIDFLVSQMDELRAMFDTPPGGPYPKFRAFELLSDLAQGWSSYEEDTRPSRDAHEHFRVVKRAYRNDARAVLGLPAFTVPR